MRMHIIIIITVRGIASKFDVVQLDHSIIIKMKTNSSTVHILNFPSQKLDCLFKMLISGK